jgi:hypothetical protein
MVHLNRRVADADEDRRRVRAVVNDQAIVNQKIKAVLCFDKLHQGSHSRTHPRRNRLAAGIPSGEGLEILVDVEPHVAVVIARDPADDAGQVPMGEVA